MVKALLGTTGGVMDGDNRNRDLLCADICEMPSRAPYTHTIYFIVSFIGLVCKVLNKNGTNLLD
jgi:hypothetical protein